MGVGRRIGIAGVALLACAFAGGTLAGDAAAGRFTLRATVTSVADGDTLRVVTAAGRSERVRLVGVDAPERGRCYASEAAAAARRLSLGRDVVLRGDPTQDTRDRYGRLLAYVWLPGGRDLGFQLIRGGYARAYVFERPFERLAAYRRAEADAKRLSRSVWRCAAPSSAAGPSCDASYPDVCIPPYERVGDLDCRDVPYRRFRVVGPDPHGFDGDRHCVGCERRAPHS